jgi:hypothetical protein
MNERELFVLHCLWDMPAYYKLFSCNDVGGVFNIPLEFPNEELEPTIRALLKDELLYIKENHFDEEEIDFARRNGRRVLGLTPKGGKVWESYISPDWGMYLSDIDDEKHCSGEYVFELRSVSLDMILKVKKIIHKRFNGAVNFHVKESNKFLYWKKLDCFVLNFSFGCMLLDVDNIFLGRIYDELDDFHRPWSIDLYYKYKTAIDKLRKADGEPSSDGNCKY